ncbi:hypothetical protein QAD02_023653 [Eretmocerus hayati]|uniref:Uncharacterized protein n=1 Tax=Eretmocerus hayati TaxID=131215 RepID=A0ACC2PXK9_9HYME|nr:hypothetical protein QAD02_023653 [Eretmocerus hayati]
MGSTKRHKSDKSRELKKKRPRSRSRSYSPEREKTERHKHHKKHKKKDRKDYDSDVEIIGAPPPPKISRTSHLATPPPPEISFLSKEDKYYNSRDEKYSLLSKEEKHSYTKDERHHSHNKEDRYAQGKEDKHYSQSKEEKQHTHSRDDRLGRSRKSPSPIGDHSGQSQLSLSIEETNKLRAKLGLKPLEVDTGPTGDSDLIKDDLGEFHHKPAINVAQKEKTQKIKEKIDTMKQKRQIESSLKAIRTLGDSDSDEDAMAWIKKSRKIEEEKKKAAERAKLLDQMDEEFGIDNLVREEVSHERRNAYTDRDLRGLRVEHNLDNFQEGNQVILTLKDDEVLAENEDVLVNVNMIDDERYKKNILIRSKKPGYDPYDESNFDENGLPINKILEKYDEEIDGEKRESFAIGLVDAKKLKQQKAALVKDRLANKRLESLELPEPKLASEYYNPEEMVKFKKTKKKVRKIRGKKLKADDLILDRNDYLRDLGCRRRRREQTDDTDNLDHDDLEAPKEDLSGLKIEEEDRDLEIEMRKVRQTKRPIPELKPEKIAMTIKQEVNTEDFNSHGNIVLNSTAEFCRTLGDIPTYGQAGNRDENVQEFMDFEMDEVKQEELDDDEMNGRGAWNAVEIDNSSLEPVALEAAILDAEPSLDQGVGGALKLAMSKGYLEKEDAGRPSASRFAHLQAQKYSIEDKSYGDDDKFGRRDRFSGPTSEFREKEGFRPNVKLEYIDDDGHLLNAKEAFRYLSHKFHGKGPGKNKVEKRMKKSEQECLMKRMSSTDTPLGTLTLLQAKQKETQSPFIVLSGSKQMQTCVSYLEIRFVDSIVL